MKERIITAFIMIVVVVGIVFFLPFLFAPLIAVILGISIWEWCRISQIRRPNSYFVAAATIILWVAAALFPTLLTILLILSVIQYFYAIRLICHYEQVKSYRINTYYLMVCGPVVLAALAASLIYIFNYSPEQASIDDALSLTFIIMVIAAADSGAYFVGRFLGKHKLCPHVSPKKTIEGLIGGLVSVLLVVIFFDFMVESWFLSFLQLLFISLITALFSVIGDLFISVIKRQNHIKDASQILPGHGGFLDRIDGLLAGVPVFYLLQQLI